MSIHMLPFQTETEAQAIFLYQFTICSSFKRKYISKWIKGTVQQKLRWVKSGINR